MKRSTQNKLFKVFYAAWTLLIVALIELGVLTTGFIAVNIVLLCITWYFIGRVDEIRRRRQETL